MLDGWEVWVHTISPSLHVEGLCPLVASNADVGSACNTVGDVNPNSLLKTYILCSVHASQSCKRSTPQAARLCPVQNMFRIGGKTMWRFWKTQSWCWAKFWLVSVRGKLGRKWGSFWAKKKVVFGKCCDEYGSSLLWTTWGKDSRG